jgi:NADH dehydrogenase
VVDAVQFPNSPIENPKKGFTFERIDLGGTKNLVDAAKAAGVPRFIGISGVGADEHGEYPWLRYKWQEEQYIVGSGVPYTIIRGSWVYGPHDVSLNRFLGFASWLPFIPVIGNGKTRINPLFIEDLGAHVTAAVERDDLRGQTFELGGPDTLTMDEIVRGALTAAGKKRFILHQPKFLMKIVASVVQHVPGRPLTPDAIDFITQDGTADVEPLKDAFGLPLTPLEEGLATYLPRKK